MSTRPGAKIFLLLVASSACASTPVNTGYTARARVTVAEPPGETTTYEGELRRWNADTLAMILDSGPLREFDALSVVSVEQQTGTKNSWLAGGLIGAAAGVVVAVIGTMLDSSQESGSDVAVTAGAYALAWSLAIPIGFGLGALIGASVETDKWEPASSDDWFLNEAN